MYPTDEIPEYFSQKRAMALSGCGRKRIAKLTKHGPFAQVARSDVEHLLMNDRRVTPELWDQVTREGLR
jgi:hypothetical protein